jgi:hypothetical protein
MTYTIPPDSVDPDVLTRYRNTRDRELIVDDLIPSAFMVWPVIFDNHN